MSQTKIIETTTVEEKNEKEDIDPTLRAFEDFMEGVGGGSSIEVYRFEPKDLEGFLESIPVVTGEKPISLSYLAERWGGKVLRLMLRDEKGQFISRKLIPLKSYPPRLEGVDIDTHPRARMETKTGGQYDPFELFLKMQEVTNRNYEAHRPPPGPDLTGLLSQVIPVLLQGILNRPEPKVQTMDDMLRQLAIMKSFLGNPEGGAPSEEETILPFVMKMSEQLLAKPEPKKLSAPSQSSSNVVPITNNNENNVLNPTVLTQFVKQLKGEDAATAVFAALQQMPESEAEKAVETLMRGFGYSEEEKEDDDPEDIGGEA